jgi:hypothetical protein
MTLSYFGYPVVKSFGFPIFRFLTIPDEGYSRVSEWVSEWLLFNANSVICQLYHGERVMLIKYDIYRFTK